MLLQIIQEIHFSLNVRSRIEKNQDHRIVFYDRCHLKAQLNVLYLIMKGHSHDCKPEMDREPTEISHKSYSENMFRISATQF
jgi:hypothetical protein